MATYVPKKSRDDVYRFFFTEGVVVCKKDALTNWTGTLGGKAFTVPNLQVMQLMRSLKSRGLIKEQYAWRHYYWFLNDEGVNYMRDYLHLAPSAMPNTLKPSENLDQYNRGGGDERGEGRGRGRGRGRGGRGRGFGEGRGRGGRGRGFGGERADYRGATGAEGADVDAPVQQAIAQE